MAVQTDLWQRLFSSFLFFIIISKICLFYGKADNRAKKYQKYFGILHQLPMETVKTMIVKSDLIEDHWKLSAGNNLHTIDPDNGHISRQPITKLPKSTQGGTVSF